MCPTYLGLLWTVSWARTFAGMWGTCTAPTQLCHRACCLERLAVSVFPSYFALPLPVDACKIPCRCRLTRLRIAQRPRGKLQHLRVMAHRGTIGLAPPSRRVCRSLLLLSASLVGRVVFWLRSWVAHTMCPAIPGRCTVIIPRPSIALCCVRLLEIISEGLLAFYSLPGDAY